MWQFIVLMGLIGMLAPCASASLICLKAGTNQVLEYQSRGRPGTCLRNWVTNNPQYGYTESDIEERQVSPLEAKQLLAVWEADDTNPNKARRIQRQQDQAQRANRMKAKLGLSDAEWEELKDALRTP